MISPEAKRGRGFVGDREELGEQARISLAE